jgi:NAD(P)-dependent dehydrogenase (short-subunit alcohol dehydrogenase family)
MAALNPPIRDWKGRDVWVVGASSGIGQALAEQLTRLGARVTATARRTEALHALSPPPHRVLAADIADAASLGRAVGSLFENGQKIDVVFWVAGVYQPMGSEAINLGAVRETFEVNVLSGYDGLSQVLEQWRSQPAQGPRHWVWVSSVAGYRGLPQACAYGASKAALTYLAETNYLELKRFGIAVSVVSPGFVESRLTAKNDFQMPAMISPEQAAEETIKGMAKGVFEIHYPKRFTRLMKLLEMLPYRLYFAIAARALRK